MRFDSFDFLSSSPQNFIFQRRTNRTNFGGFLSFIYLLIFLTITGFYLISYFNEDDYSIQYLYISKITKREEKMELYNDERYNPYFNLYFNFSSILGKEFADRFQMRAYINYQARLNTSKIYKVNVQNFDMYVVYDCIDKKMEECSIDDVDKYSNEKFITLNMYYNGFIIDHQNKTSPLYRGEGITYNYALNFDVFVPSRRNIKWTNIKYKEDKGFLSMFENNEDNDYIGLGVKSLDFSEISDEDGNKNFFVPVLQRNLTVRFFKVVGRVKFDIDFNNYDEYKRTPKSLWDSIANICSLSTTIFNALSFIVIKFFSNSFDNYKLIEKILLNSNIKQENKEKIENKEINKEIKDIDNNKENLLDKSNEDKNSLNINENDNNNDEDKIIIDKDFNIDDDNFPNLNFFDIIFNGIYDDKCCCKLNKKKLIEKCNEIISKYYSIENIIYNQIMIENILKDYRWNDPELNNIDNNELITQIKNIILSFHG